jgi:hypothetical protein
MKGLVGVIAVMAAAVISLAALPASAIEHKYIESFSTTQYKDPMNTTAWWDTVAGELKLFPFVTTIVGTCDTPSNAWCVAVSGDRAFVADYSSGLQVIDISDPASPTLIGTYNTPGSALGVTVSGYRAFVADGAYGLQVIDISDPASPTLVGTCGTPGDAYGVTVSGNHAFVADYSFGLTVIDISDPASPAVVGNYNTPGYAYGVAVSGDRAFVADFAYGLQVIDISDPASPTLIGTCDTPGSALCVTVSGDRAFVADYGSGLQVIDISDSVSPTLIGAYDTPGAARGVTVSGDRAFVADYGYGLQMIDISDPANPALVGTCNTPGYAYSVTISGDRAFVADYAYGLQVIRISGPALPALVGACETPDWARGVTVSGDHAFVADANSGLQVIDISDPASPALVGTYDTPGSAYAVTVSGDRAFVADYSSGLQVIDISDPATPTLVGTYDTPGFARDVTVSGDRAFVADYDAGLQVIDISDPATPTLVGTCDTPDHAIGVAVSGDHAFVADGSSGLQVIDISDPASPALVGTYNTAGGAYGVTVSGDRAFVAVFGSGLQVIDISDPATPTLVGTCDTPGYALGVTVSGNRAFVADRDFGLQVIQVFQSEVDAANNVGRSLTVDASNDTICAARVLTTQENAVTWELSADGGVSWQGITPNGNWNLVTVPGTDLVWRSTHTWAAPGVNPGVTQLEIEWLHQSPMIKAITDVGNDQGRHVRIGWTRSGDDFVGASPQVTGYAIYRKIDYSLGSQRMSVLSDRGEPLRAYPPGDWDYVKTISARAEDTYFTIVPTLGDSTIAEGMYYTTFFVSALTGTPTTYYDSAPDSGYSVDNVAPAKVGGFTVTYNTGSGNHLSWAESEDEDFSYFCVYRGMSEGFASSGFTLSDFAPTEEDRVAVTTATAWSDPEYDGSGVYYLLTVVDISGNESDPISPEAVTSADASPTPKAYRLGQNYPNPFNPATLIRFDIKDKVHTTLRIYNVSGELVRTLVDEVLPARSYSVEWNGRNDTGREATSGVYFYKLEAGSFRDVRKMILVR